MKNKVVKKIFSTAAFITAFVAIILSCLSVISISLLLGWLLGALISSLSFYFNTLKIKFLFKKKRTKKNAIWTSLLFFSIQIIWWTVSILGIVWIDVAYNHDVLFITGGTYDVMNPINIITFIGGVSVIAISVVISHIPWLKGKEGENGTV